MTSVDPEAIAHVREALALATLAEGATRPNPMVGCVVVKDGRVVGRGWHAEAGSAHAESQALDEAGARARGAELFVNLEPCVHHGRTPPCTERILAAGVSRVTAAIEDPDPRVSGRGFAALRAAGVEVRCGVLEDEARRLNAAFFHWHETGRPWVSLKVAVTLDGQLAAAEGRSRWISGACSRRHGHRLRRAHDAIWVGAETYRADAPRLTVRLEEREDASRPAIVWSGTGDVPYREGRAPERPIRLLLPEASVDRARRAGWPDDVLWPVRAAGARVDVDDALSRLAAEDLRSVLVEGGGRTFAAFLEAGRVDRVYRYASPGLVGARGATPWLPMRTAEDPARGWRFVEESHWDLGVDRLRVGTLERAGDRGPTGEPGEPGEPGEAACSPD